MSGLVLLSVGVPVVSVLKRPFLIRSSRAKRGRCPLFGRFLHAIGGRFSSCLIIVSAISTVILLGHYRSFGLPEVRKVSGPWCIKNGSRKTAYILVPGWEASRLSVLGHDLGLSVS